MVLNRYFWYMADKFLHDIDVNSLKNELKMDVSDIAKLAEISENGVYKWSWDKFKNGTRPSYNAIVRLLQKGATVETLFGVNYAEIHNYVPKLPLEPDDSPMDYNDPKFIEALEKGIKIIEERKKKAGESQ